LSSSRSDLAKLGSLTARDRWLVVRAALALPVSVVLLRVAGYQRARRLGRRLARRTAPADVEPRIAATVRAVDLATTRLPIRSACLSQSLALSYLLDRQGIPTEICFGVRAGGAPLDAHAWVEHDGHPINETADIVATYGRLQPGDQ
jgi:hypothetical protein